MTDKQTLDKLIADEPGAREQFKPGDTWGDMSPDDSDFNLHYVEMAAEPDPASDPFREQP